MAPAAIGNTVGLGSIVVIQDGQSTAVPGTCAFGGEGNPTYVCDTVTVPEPPTFAMIGLSVALLMVAFARRRDQRE